MSDEAAVAPGVPIASSSFRSPGFRSVYSNLYRIKITGSDLTITFAAFVDNPANFEQMAVLEEVAVTMAWPQVKTLATQLGMLVKEIEVATSPLKMSRGLNGAGPDLDAVKAIVKSLDMIDIPPQP